MINSVIENNERASLAWCGVVRTSHYHCRLHRKEDVNCLERGVNNKSLSCVRVCCVVLYCLFLVVVEGVIFSCFHLFNFIYYLL